jgi:hypothetical protein
MARTPTFNILITYESLARALRVKEMLDRLSADLESTCQVKCEFWNFDLLEHTSFRAQAAVEASGADMVIVAARGDSDLKEPVKTWFEGWLSQKQSGQGALVALLDDGFWRSGEVPRPCAFLQAAAARSNMDFFCQSGGWQPAELQYVVESVHRGTEASPALLLKEPAERNEAFFGWGIND